MRFIRYLVLSTTLACLAAVAEAPATVALNIESQPIRAALEKFAAQTGLQVVLREEELPAEGLTASRVVGTLPVEQALGKLLAGTALRYEFVNARTVKISRQDKAPITRSSAAHMQLAEVRGEGEGPRTVEAPAETREVRGAPEILVKGKRSTNTDIQRTEDDPQPYLVFERDEILRSQATNLEDFLKQRLPMNAVQDTSSQSTTSSSMLAISAVNLRGLGAHQTLILVDGRRMPGVAVFGNPVQPDINGIPLASVERIEVLPSTAGGIYGGSATGGVVNIITRKDYAGVEAGATYTNTFDTDMGGVRLDASTGFSLEGGRTQVTLSATHLQTNTLVMGDRDFVERGIARQRLHNPGAIGTSLRLGGTVNIQSALLVNFVRQPLVLDDRYGGTALGQTITHLPYGYAGPDSDGGAALVANAGSYNLDIPAGPAGRDRGLVAAPSMKSAALSVRREFTPRVEAFVDVKHLGSTGSAPHAGGPGAVFGLPADAPNNPFQQPINVMFPTPHLSFTSESQSTTVSATGGVIARLPGNWTGEIDYGWSRSRLLMTSVRSMVDATGLAVMLTGLPAPDGRPALNILQEGNSFPVDFGPYLLPTPNHFFGPYDTVMKNTTLRASGPALMLPAGPLWLSALLERRKEELLDAFNKEIDTATQDWTYSYFPYRAQTVTSAYLEARAPLVSPAQQRRWLRELEAQVSVRRDRYATYSGNLGNGIGVISPSDPLPPVDYRTSRSHSADYTVGLRYAPVEDLALRMSFGSGFLPPSVVDVVPYGTEFNFSYGLADPRRGYTDTFVGLPYEYIYGGNPDLRPEQSESWSAGFILTPRFAPGLRVSVDYTRIEKVDEFGAPEMQFLLDHEDMLPGRITRGPKLQDDPPEWAGPITAFNLGFINIAKTTLEAYDVQADYTMDTASGTFRWYVMGTWTPRYTKQSLPTLPELEHTGHSSAPLKWRGNFGLDWSRGGLTVGWNAQYFNSYIGYWAGEAYGKELFESSNGTAIVDRQMYHDLVATWRIGPTASALRGLLASTQLSVGVQNVLNTSPPILAITGPVSGRPYSGFGDPRLRRYSVSLRRSF